MVSGAPALVDGLRHLQGQFVIQHGGSFLTTLDHTIQGFLDRTLVNQFPSELVGASLVLVVVYALALLSQNYLDAHLQQSLLWRTRGGRRDRLAASFSLQMGILLLPAVLLAVALSVAAASVLLTQETGTSASLNVAVGAFIFALPTGPPLVVIPYARLLIPLIR